MIGKLLATASTVEEDRVLCTVMRAGGYVERKNSLENTQGPCLVGTMVGYTADHYQALDRGRFGNAHIMNRNVECRYDSLCGRFGEERTNTLIRNRILDNRVKRALGSSKELIQSTKEEQHEFVQS